MQGVAGDAHARRLHRGEETLGLGESCDGLYVAQVAHAVVVGY